MGHGRQTDRDRQGSFYMYMPTELNESLQKYSAELHWNERVPMEQSRRQRRTDLKTV